MTSFSDPVDLNGWMNITRLCSNTKSMSITGSKYGYWQEKTVSIKLEYLTNLTVFIFVLLF